MQGKLTLPSMNQAKKNNARRPNKAEIIKAKLRYKAMWEENRPRMLRLAALGRRVISDRHDENRRWMREWLSTKPAKMTRNELRLLIDKAKAKDDTIKTESYIKTMIRYGYVRFDEETLSWANAFAQAKP